jgi:hypothetical protein
MRVRFQPVSLLLAFATGRDLVRHFLYLQEENRSDPSPPRLLTAATVVMVVSSAPAVKQRPRKRNLRCPEVRSSSQPI